MPHVDSMVDPEALQAARDLLAEPGRRAGGVGGALAAAALFAACALGLAVAMVVAPPTVSSPTSAGR